MSSLIPNRKNVVLIILLLVSAIGTTATYHHFNRAGILYAEGRALMQKGLHKQALPYFEKCLEIRPNFKNAVRDLALVSLWNKQYGAAKRNFQKLDQMLPGNRISLRGLADIEAWTGKRLEAIAKYKKIIASNPNDIETIRSLADALYWEKEYLSAIPFYEKLLQLNPLNEQALLNFAASLEKLGRHDEALALLRKTENSNPNNPSVFKALGNHFLEKKKYSEACAYFKRAHALDSNDVEAVLQLGECLNVAGDPSAATAIVRKAASDNPEHRALQIASATYLLWSKQYKEAKDAYELFLRKWPDDPAALTGIARSYIWQGNVRDALPYISKNREYMSDAELARVYEEAKADIAIQENRFEDAINLLRAILNTNKTIGNGDKRRLHEKIADICSWQGKFDEAEREYLKATDDKTI